MAQEERKKDDLFIKPKRRAQNFFITSSAKMDGNKNTKTTISSSVLTEMSKSFSDGEHLLDEHMLSSQKPILYMLQEMQKDIDDVYNEVSASAFQASFFPFARIDSGSFGLISSSLVPGIDNKYDLGISGKEWNDLYIDGTANIDSLAMGTTVTSIKDEDNMSSNSATALATQQSIKKYVDDNAGGGGTIDSSITDGSTNAVQNNAVHDALALKATTAAVGGNLLPSKDNTRDLGSSTKEWKDLYVDGTAHIDALRADSITGNLIPNPPASKKTGKGLTIGDANNRWAGIFLASKIDVSGSNLVISSPSASAAGHEFNVIVSGSLIPGDLDSGSIGTLEKPFKDLYVQSASLYFADMSDHNGKTWKQMSKSERLNRSTIFQKEDVDKMKRGESLSDSGNISASGDFHVVGRTHLKGITLIEGNTTISGLTDVKGGFRVNGQAITDAELRALRGLSTDDSLQDQLNSKEATIGSSNKVNASHVGGGVVSNTEFNYLNGVTSAIQTQLNTKAVKTHISGAFTALSASIATDIGNAGGGTVETALKDGSTNAVTNNAVFDGLATKLNLSGGTMTGNIAMSNSVIRPVMVAATSITKFTIDMRRANIFQIKAGSAWVLRVATASHIGQEITIIGLSAGTIVNGKGKEGTFLFANGSNLSVSAGQAYKFISDVNGVWRQIH